MEFICLFATAISSLFTVLLSGYLFHNGISDSCHKCVYSVLPFFLAGTFNLLYSAWLCVQEILSWL